MTPATTATDDPRLYVRITKDLRHKITAGIIEAHANVSVTTISQDWRVSRSTVSKALRALEADGLIRYYHGAGYYVLPRTQQPAPPCAS
jgi:DNA-binding GntR family transcriptional regulator